MKDVKNIGILTDQFITWGGGIDFIRLIINGLKHTELKNGQKINIVVIVPEIPRYSHIIKNSLKRILNLFRKKKLQLKSLISKNNILDLFKDTNHNIGIIVYDGSEGSLASLVLKLNIDVLLPAFNRLQPTFPIPWVGYIYDFQHVYYPDFFSKEEVERRNNEFGLMLNGAETVIVNALEVKNDIQKFFPNAKAKVVSLPFCPVVNMHFFENNAEIHKYGLPKKYFLISNQFWKHKDHSTAFNAFKLFLDNTQEKDFGLVCTGQIHDDRFPLYFSELQELLTDLGIQKKVKILGYIPKSDQLRILKDCVGVIQPTLFEGGPGGGAVYESVAYGIPSLVSDIAVNRELDDETVTFFKAESVQDLAKKMESLSRTDRKIYTKEELIAKNQVSLKKMGTRILSLIN